MLLNKKSLMTTITSKLSAEIKKFKKTMLAEIQAINDLKVYKKQDVKKKTHVISAKWVFKEKKATFLTLTKLKTKLFAQKFTQRFKVNYEKTHALVARVVSIKAFFAVYTVKK